MKKKLLLILGLTVSTVLIAQENKEYPKPEKMTPGMTEYWEPQPLIVAPADMDNFVAPPSDAIVLFDGKDISMWEHSNGDPVKWDLKDGTLVVKRRTGAIKTKESFGDCQLHLEWMIPSGLEGQGQGRGNSGVFLQERYEVQILDNYENETYGNGQAASIYKQYAPLVNACQKQGKWNTYDIIYTAPRFKENGTLASHARITILHNGVLVQNNTVILGATEYIGNPKYKAHGDAPIVLQDHGNPVTFRNIWIREL